VRKLSQKQTLLLLGVLLLFLLNAFYAWGYWQAVGEKSEATEKLRSATQRVELLKGDYDLPRLQEELAELERRLVEEAPFPQQAEGLNLFALIVSSAQGLELSQLQSLPAGTRTIGENEYQVIGYEVSAQGELPQLKDWFQEIEESDFTTLSIEEAELTSPEGPIWNANISIVILTQ
jgi:hypothetical protein